MHPVDTSIPHNSSDGIRGGSRLGGGLPVGGPLPCLNSNISTEIDPSNPSQAQIQQGVQPLSTQHRKSSCVLSLSVAQMAQKYGLERLGFLTLTFADHVTDPKEAQRRFNSLVTHVIKPRYADYVGVLERQKSGRIHYHLLVALSEDIRSGADFEQFSQGNYVSASLALRSEWAFWRKTAKAYRFGRTELLPIRSTVEAISKYVGKYIAKHIEVRKDEDKGVRLVRYSQGARAGTTRFSFNSNGSKNWRYKLSLFAEIMSQRLGVVLTYSDFRKYVGPKWAYHYRDFIMSLPDYPIE